MTICGRCAAGGAKAPQRDCRACMRSVPIGIRGRESIVRFVRWAGPFPSPGEGVIYESGRRYVITARDPRTARMTSTIFRLHLRELGPEDPDPKPLYPCVRDVRKTR